MAEEIYARGRSPRHSRFSVGKSHVSRGKSPKENPLKILNAHELRGLKRTIGPPLIECMSEIIEKRPEDPIEYMAMWLYNYVDSQFYLMNKVDLSKQLMEAEQEREDAIIFRRKQLEEVRRRIQNFKIKLAIYEESARIRKMQELEEKRLNERMLRLKEMLNVQTVVVQKKWPFRRKSRSTGGTSMSEKSTITTETHDDETTESESEEEDSEEIGQTDKEKASGSSTAVSSTAGSGRSRASESGKSQGRRKSHREQEEAGGSDEQLELEKRKRGKKPRGTKKAGKGEIDEDASADAGSLASSDIEKRKKQRRLLKKKSRKRDEDASADAGSLASSDIEKRKKERPLRKKKPKKQGVDKVYGEEGTADDLDEKKTAAPAKRVPGKSSRFQRAGSYAEPLDDKGGAKKKSMAAKLLEKAKKGDQPIESSDENDSHEDERKRGGKGAKSKHGGKRKGDSTSPEGADDGARRKARGKDAKHLADKGKGSGSKKSSPASYGSSSRTPGSRSSDFHSAKISEATSPVQAEWALDEDNRLTCFHPELGILGAPKAHIDDSPDAWVALGYACETFYDHEIYTNCDVLTGIPIKIDNKKKKKRKRRLKIRTAFRSSTSSKSEDSPTQEQEIEEQEIEEQEMEEQEIEEQEIEEQEQESEDEET